MNMEWNPPPHENIRWWYKRCQTIGFLCKFNSRRRPRVLHKTVERESEFISYVDLNEEPVVN